MTRLASNSNIRALSLAAYHIILYALFVPAIDIAPSASADMADFYIRQYALEKAEIIATATRSE